MALAKAWRELHRKRFAELPLDCGNAINPGVIDSEDLRDWSAKGTTPDQGRMERYIDRHDMRQKRILHIGVGNSGLATRLHRRAKEIVGTTIDEPEMELGEALGFPNYQVVMHNKFSGQDEIVPGKFDFILDNNPTSPCCCIRHLAVLFDFYVAKLANGGQLVTDTQGLQWVPEHSNTRWSFDFDDLTAVASTVGLSAFKANQKVYVLSRAPPPNPGLRALARHGLRSAGRFPAKMVRNGNRAIVARVRKSLKWLLLSTVPGALPERYKNGQD
jgi:hypothetical protein